MCVFCLCESLTFGQVERGRLLVAGESQYQLQRALTESGDEVHPVGVFRKGRQIVRGDIRLPVARGIPTAEHAHEQNEDKRDSCNQPAISQSRPTIPYRRLTGIWQSIYCSTFTETGR